MNRFKPQKSDFSYDGRFIHIKERSMKILKDIFNDRDIEAEIKKMEEWLIDHPPKKDWRRFVCNWLRRSPSKYRRFDELPQHDLGSRTMLSCSLQVPKQINFIDELAKLKSNYHEKK